MVDAKEKLKEKKVKLIELTTGFSQQYLNEEYNVVIEQLVQKMARKRDVPFQSGKIEIWAAAVIHALGTVNFLFDKANEPYASVTDICEFFGTKQSTTTQKSKKIRDMFNMTYFDDQFAIKTMKEQNPFDNITMINGLSVPQDMVMTPKPVELEDWEVSVAHLLDIPNLVKGKTYNESDLFDLLAVTNEKLEIFYGYLQNHLSFPFSATYQQDVGPLSVAEYDVNCLRLDQIMEFDEFYGIYIECRQERKKVTVTLAEIEVDEENPNYALIQLYQAWFWKYR
ncbi:DUF6398 domain-containing protein [Radiobacillus sp. PE A8.2]|uniref:DUF6398 domain-containing protein n=1 Tax=Radiobacillus sp. PE A8.2 TaxID=3380349 RepID=UPI00388DF303